MGILLVAAENDHQSNYPEFRIPAMAQPLHAESLRLTEMKSNSDRIRLGGQLSSHCPSFGGAGLTAP